MSIDAGERTGELKALAYSLGADLVGVADLAPLGPVFTQPAALLALFTFGISVAVRLSDAVVDAITPTDPTVVYAHHYATANALLDQITFRLAGHIQRQGHRAMPIHASQQMGSKRWFGAISHKAIARGAGLGWIGQNLLLITPEHGPRVRLASLLTDMPLASGGPMPRRCGGCRVCVDACPARALLGFELGEHPESRELALDTAACAQRLDFFEQEASVGQPVCGVCVQVCPFGRKRG
jgi:epoxyqueuosine reductase